MIFWQIVFWLSLIMCIYIYAGYPAAIFIVSHLRGISVARQRDLHPSVTLIVPAFNEAEAIASKIENSLALDYPADRVEILVISDGSTDATEDIVTEMSVRHGRDRIRLLKQPRSGKAIALNNAVKHAKGDILVFTDANGLLEQQSLNRLVEPFADEDVGGVSGHKRYRTGTGADAIEQGENLYWRYDTLQKKLESRIGSIIAADGSLFAIRKDLYVPIEDPAQADDMAISMRVVLQGYRLIYEPTACVYETPPADGRREFFRKVRVTNHSLRAMLNLGHALWTSGWYSFQLLSHKFFRHLVPIYLLGLFAASAMLVGAAVEYQILFWAQSVFYTLALIGFSLRHNKVGRLFLVSIPYFFTSVNLAALFGILSTLKGERCVTWQPREGISP